MRRRQDHRRGEWRLRYWIGRALLQGRSGPVWNTLRTIVVCSGKRLNCCDGLMRKLKPDECACALRSSDEETESSHEVTDGGEFESKRLAITFTGHDVACKVGNTTQILTRRHSWAYSVLESPKHLECDFSEAVRWQSSWILDVDHGWHTNTLRWLCFVTCASLGAQVKEGCCIQRAFWQSRVFRFLQIVLAVFSANFQFQFQTVHARCLMSSVCRCTRPKPFSEDFILSQKVAEKHFHLSFWSFWPILLLTNCS